MDPSRVDVAIVGGGPAGAGAAWRLARAGARVVLLDGSHPREKACGGGLTGRALDLVRGAIDPLALPGVAIDEAGFEQGPQALTMPLGPGRPGRPRLVILPRQTFDGALLDAAVAAGARLVPARVRRVARESGAWTVSTAQHTFRADWLLGADGAASLVRRTVHEPFARADLSIATGYYAHGQSSSRISLAFPGTPGGYLWSFPRPDHLAVGACAQADDTSAAALRAMVSEWIGRHAPGATRLEPYSWPIPSLRVQTLRREPPSGDGWMLLGDAGGMVDPITREGIYFALASAELAAASLAGPDAGGAYADRVRQTIHPELIRAARLKTQFFRPRFTALLLRALRVSPSIRLVMADLIAGEQPYHGLRRRLLRTGEWRLAIRMVTGT